MNSKLSEECPFCGGSGCDKCNGSGKRENIDDSEFKWNTFPVCPYCGEEDYDFVVDGPHLEDQEETGHMCPSCGIDYQIMANIQITYDTETIGGKS